jgi:hypothetical protein
MRHVTVQDAQWSNEIQTSFKNQLASFGKRSLGQEKLEVKQDVVMETSEEIEIHTQDLVQTSHTSTAKSESKAQSAVSLPVPAKIVRGPLKGFENEPYNMKPSAESKRSPVSDSDFVDLKALKQSSKSLQLWLPSTLS